MQEIELGVTCDMHVHVREGALCELVTPTIREGGVSVAYVMPNLTPPVTTLERVVAYKRQLEELSPQTTFLMSFYLSRALTVELLARAAQLGAVSGVKCYPAGVTTNSAAGGVDPNDFSEFYPLFAAMQEHGLVLNLHGEKPSAKKNGGDGGDGDDDITVLNAEEKFLPALEKLHEDFPELRIVLEHCSTAKAVALLDRINEQDGQLRKNPPLVAGTITAHHLHLTVDDWAGNPVNFCKPVAKLPSDQRALVAAATSGKPWFFFGSDSAPHAVEAKTRCQGIAAGVFTQRYALAYVAEAFDRAGRLANLDRFVSLHPLQFYGVAASQLKCPQDRAVLFRRTHRVPATIGGGDGSGRSGDAKDSSDCSDNNSGSSDNAKHNHSSATHPTVVPFLAGELLHWDVRWK